MPRLTELKTGATTNDTECLGVNVDDTPPPPTPLPSPNFSVPRGLLEIWKMMLEKTDELAKHRLKVAEMMLSQISEEMRQQKRIKEQTYKRVSGGEGRRMKGRGGRRRRRGGGGWVYMTITLSSSVSVLK